MNMISELDKPTKYKKQALICFELADIKDISKNEIKSHTNALSVVNIYSEFVDSI